MVPALVTATARTGGLLLAASVGVFAATGFLPGDAAQARTGGRASAAQLAELRAGAGLDRPAWLRYWDWLTGLLRGDAGTSLVSDRPVVDLVAQRLPATVILAAVALALTVPLMFALGGLAARGPRILRPATAAVVVAGAAVPQVVLAAGLVALLSGLLGWLPPVSLLPVGASPLTAPELRVLPALSLALPSAAYGAALLRGAIGDAAQRPHVADAALRGVPPMRLAARHLLPFVLAPATRVLAVVAGALIAATTVVETLFGYAGLGELLVAAIATRDVPVVQCVALLAAAVVLAGLLVADLVAAATDERRVSTP